MKGAKAERLNFLDGLRGWAALAVLLYHTFVEVFYYNQEIKTLLSNFLLFQGIAAVYVFFVISGFSLSASYVRTGDSRALARIAASRYSRLALPILAACCLVYLLMVSGLIPAADHRLYPLNTALRFEPNIVQVFRFSLFDVFFRFSYDEAYILPLWTMQPEFIGSAIVISLLAVFGRSKRRLWIYGAIYTALSISALVYSLSGFLALFIAGLILAELYHRWSPRKILDYILLTSLFVFGWFAPYVASQRASFLYFAGMIGFCAAAFWLPWVRDFLQNGPSRLLGRISFPLYLVHGPVLYSFSLYALDKLKPLGFGPAVTNTIVAFITIPVAIGCAMAFEPVNRGAVWASRRFGEAVVACAMTLWRRRLATAAAHAADVRSCP